MKKEKSKQNYQKQEKTFSNDSDDDSISGNISIGGNVSFS